MDKNVVLWEVVNKSELDDGESILVQIEFKPVDIPIMVVYLFTNEFHNS